MLSRRRLIAGFLPVLASGAGTGMPWADSSHIGRPFSKDPSVIRWGGRYLMYYSMPRKRDGERLSDWAVGIAESRDLRTWSKVGEVLPEQECESKGLAAPFAKVTGGAVHLFYQTYGNGRRDAICHAESKDGLRFRRDETNPIFRPTGDWNAGRAIDAEVVQFRGKWFLYAATRDPEMKVQMVVGAVSRGGFGRDSWKMAADRPLLKPELPWEKDCIEAPSVVVRGSTMYMFYAGAYNCAPQQIGCARSKDGVEWERLFQEPLLANGKAGEWNSSESGHPGAFVDDDGKTYLFYQGSQDMGKTWFLSMAPVGWRGGRPYIAG